MANSVDPDQTPRPAASDQGLNCFPRHVCPSSHSAFVIKCFFRITGTLFRSKFANFCHGLM